MDQNNAQPEDIVHPLQTEAEETVAYLKAVQDRAARVLGEVSPEVSPADPEPGTGAAPCSSLV